MPTDVHMRFQDDHHREAVLERLRPLTLFDGELVEDGEGDRYVIGSEDPNAAVVRVLVIVRGALDGSGIDPASVALSADRGWG